jgi:hypothetical protein
MSSVFDTKSDYDRGLLERAACWPACLRWCDLTAAWVQQLSEREGIDFATALLYDRLLRSAEHGTFIERMETLTEKLTTLRRLDATLVIVPGGFYVEFPHTGADGRVLREAAAQFGCTAELVPLASFGSLTENVRILCDWLTSRPAGNVILVSLSKGGSEVKLALARPDAQEIFRNVVCWVNLGGLLRGTPLVEWLFARRLRRWWVRLLFWLRGYNFAAVPGLARGHGTLLDFDLRLPQHMQAIHIVGFPLTRHLSNRLARRCHRRVKYLGPNDGGGIILTDVLGLPGHIYPVWGADHYMRPSGRDLGELARSIFLYLHEELSERAVPASLAATSDSKVEVSV